MTRAVRNRAPAVAATIAAALSCGSPAAGSDADGVKGRVLDVTCYGPCTPETTDPRLYEGEATIVIRRLPQDRRVASEMLEDGRFRTQLRPGRYRLTVEIADPCWRGDSKKAEVVAGFERVRLEVYNGCIL